ncbi:MAG TPA: hypothetical protein VLK22_03005 [Candidatus Udaeobacter sp.]|nr:hypothetical protein [Candidatus Udaeobacter sp.]
MPNVLIEKITQMNLAWSREFLLTSPQRAEYRQLFPTEIAVTMCMDGRVNLPRWVKALFGLFTVFRNIGGKYCLGWPLMNSSISEWYNYVLSKGRRALLIITYHYSKSDRELGCAGFNFDTQAAKQAALEFKLEVDRACSGTISTLLVGLETDDEKMVIHGADDSFLDVSECEGLSESALRRRLSVLLPNIPGGTREDLMPLIRGNVEHMADVHKTRKEPIHLHHNERVLAVGRGFSWLNNNNFALVIGPCDPDLDSAIVTAAEIIEDNWQQGRIVGSGVLLVSTGYRHAYQRGLAISTSRYLAEFAMKHIRKKLPSMGDFFHPCVGVLCFDDHRFEECQ